MKTFHYTPEGHAAMVAEVEFMLNTSLTLLIIAALWVLWRATH